MRSPLIMVTALAVAALSLWLIAITAAPAFDDGRYDGANPKIRQWFKSVRSPSGIPCCDIADGRRTEWRATSVAGTSDVIVEVPIDGEWVRVPPEAIVRGAGNPTGEAIVWLRQDKQIRCFVFGPQG